MCPEILSKAYLFLHLFVATVQHNWGKFFPATAVVWFTIRLGYMTLSQGNGPCFRVTALLLCTAVVLKLFSIGALLKKLSFTSFSSLCG